MVMMELGGPEVENGYDGAGGLEVENGQHASGGCKCVVKCDAQTRRFRVRRAWVKDLILTTYMGWASRKFVFLCFFFFFKENIVP